MSSPYVPPVWQAERPPGQPASMGLQVDVKLPKDADAADRGVLMQQAGEIVQNNSTLLDRFITNQRQQVSLSGNQYHDRKITGDRLNARYRYNGGQEKLNLEVHPTTGSDQRSGTKEDNLDGYILWIHGEPNYPNIGGDNKPLPLGPWALFLNGYCLDQRVQPREVLSHAENCCYYAMLFGKTALLTNSYTGDEENKNPLLKIKQLSKPLKLVPDRSGSTISGVQITGTAVNEIAEKLGYWVFDWLNVHNQVSFIRNEDTSTGYRWDDPDNWSPYPQLIPTPLSKPKLMKGIFFPDVEKDKSPLSPRGQNVVGTTLSAGGDVSFVSCVECFVAEFYDRGKYNTLTQSWTVPIQEKRSILATNKPLYFGGFDYQHGYSTGQGSNMEFSLDPKDTKDPKGDNNFNLLGPFDYMSVSLFGNPGFGPGDALTPEQSALIDAWRAENKALLDPFYKKQGDDIAAADALIHAMEGDGRIAVAHLMATLLRIYHGDVTLYHDGIFISFKGDDNVYRVDPLDNNSPYVPWAINHITLPDDPINLYTYSYHEISASGEFYTNTVGGISAYMGFIPKDKDAAVHMDRRLQSQWINDWNEFVHQAQHTEGTSSSVDIPGFRSETFNGHIVDNDFTTYYADVYYRYGPAQFSGLMPQVLSDMTAIMTEYHGYQVQRQEAVDRVPPTPTPFPHLTGDIAKFRFSRFGSDWLFNQNPQ